MVQKPCKGFCGEGACSVGIAWFCCYLETADRIDEPLVSPYSYCPIRGSMKNTHICRDEVLNL